MNTTAQALFDFLKDILYAPDSAKLDLQSLDPDFYPLGEGMQFLADCIRESRHFVRALAKGDLSLTPPGGDNVLAAPFKEMQGSLRHLAWQTQQIAKGDYSQRVDFMGEFSTAFNTMTEQLKERTDGLIQEKEKVEQKNQELRQNLDLVLALTNYTHNMIFVLASHSEKEIFVNQPAQWFQKANPGAAQQLQTIMRQRRINNRYGSEFWETEVAFPHDTKAFYKIESFELSWLEERAMVHIVMDDTQRKKRETMMYSLAYTDPLTGLSNRRYAMDRMDELIHKGIPFLLTFVDLDYLKYCNDMFGHNNGDYYLTKAAQVLKTMGGELCRVGGDEFILIQPGTDLDEQNQRLSKLRDLLHKQNEKPYPMSFSYATSLVPANPPRTLDEYIQQTDVAMYHYKVHHKRPLHEVIDASYKDERIE